MHRVGRLHMRIITTIAVAGLCLWTAAAAQAPEKYTSRLAPVPIDTSMLGRITGVGSMTAEVAGNKLTLKGTFTGLSSPATTAQLRQGDYPGVRGPIVTELTITKGTSGIISGSLDLTAAQRTVLKGARFYVQIQSEGAPDGNLWGWLSPSPAK